MFFNNAIAYTFTKPFTHTASDLEDQLQELAIKPIQSHDLSKCGWTSAIKGTQSLTHSGNGKVLICLKNVEKIIPAAAVRELLEEKVALIELERGQKVGKKEKQTLKEELIQSIAPTALTKTSLLYGYIDIVNQMIIVNTPSCRKAEAFLALLRQSLGSLPILPMKPESELMIIMTDWVKGKKLDQRFNFGQNVKLKALDEDAAKANLNNHDVSEEEVQTHIGNGKFVERLGLTWNDKVGFELHEDGTLKKVRFCDLVKEQNADIPSDDYLAKFDADFVLGAGELTQLLLDLRRATTFEAKEAA